MLFNVVLPLLCLTALCKGEDVFVTVEHGTLRGETATSLYGTNYTRFLGVPYAAPPLGELRFEPPQPVTSWEGVRDALHESAVCTQGTGGSEDCLYLNVYIPATESTDPLSVLFWIPGGGFTFGGGTLGIYGPDFIMDHGVILVTINYRLSAFGFLSLEDDVVPGNMGLKDMVAALQWAQLNIASFGGDPDQVTLGGESAAGVALTMMLVSPLTEGLFSRIIIHSGSMVSGTSVVSNPRELAFRMGALLGLETDDSQELINFLRTLNETQLLINTEDILTEEEKLLLSKPVWSPAVEPESDGAFISQLPTDMLKNGQLHQMPIITGVTSGEFGIFSLSDTEGNEVLNEQFEAAVGPCLLLPTEEQQTVAASRLRNFYFGNATISAENTPWGIANFTNDISFFVPANTFVRYVANTTDVPVYYYEFDYRGNNMGDTSYGVVHASELSYLFVRNDTVQETDPSTVEAQVRQNMLRLWTNFVKYGNPTPEADPVVWSAYDVQSRPYLLMQDTFSLAFNRIGERMDFWEENVPF